MHAQPLSKLASSAAGGDVVPASGVGGVVPTGGGMYFAVGALPSSRSELEYGAPSQPVSSDQWAPAIGAPKPVPVDGTQITPSLPR